MFVVHFFDHHYKVLTQYRDQVPAVDENIKIKGRKGKIISVKNIEANTVHVHIQFEQIIKKPAIAKDDKKKRR